MPMSSIPWQYLLSFHNPDDVDHRAPNPVTRLEADNSPIMSIQDPVERAQAIARALTAGVKGADPKQLARSVLDGILGYDV